MSATPKVAVSDVKAALAAAVGAHAVTTAPDELDAYTADTYWPALAATAAGTPLARPEIVVRPRTEEDVAAVLAAAGAPWATVGGYIAARGSGVLSTRYGKIEDLLLNLRVATPATGLIETVEVPRHAVGPELTQLFVGSEGTLGVITRATLQLVPMPPERRFAAVAFPSVGAGIHALRRWSEAGAPAPAVPTPYPAGARARLPPRQSRGDSGAPPPGAAAGGTAATTSTTPRTSPSYPRSGGHWTWSRPMPGSRRSTRRCTGRCACPTPTRASSCGCTSRTGTPGAR